MSERAISSPEGKSMVTLRLVCGSVVQLNGVPARLAGDTLVNMRAENVPLAFGEPGPPSQEEASL